jgi:tetratricopeptide (TPR) repeat protein
VDMTMKGVQGDLKIGPTQDSGQGFAYQVSGDAQFSARNRMLQARYAEAEGDVQTSILHTRRAIELQPLNADYHFQLGALLGKIGQIDEGIQECRIALQLKPGWDLPRIEIGIILINNHRYEEGRKHLEETARIVGTPTMHLSVSLGYARMCCKDFGGALELFDVVLREKPDHALALDCAAHCCFLLGETDRGIALVKEAFKHGASDTYREWCEGKYRKR